MVDVEDASTVDVDPGNAEELARRLLSNRMLQFNIQLYRIERTIRKVLVFLKYHSSFFRV